MHDSRGLRSRSWFPSAGALGLALLLGLTGCAPEPVAGQGGKESDVSRQESSWSDPIDDLDAEQRQTELRADFPTAEFPVPPDATIYDTGSRVPGTWFLVLSAEDETIAAALWDEVIRSGAYTVADETPTPEGGRSATLANGAFRAVAVTIPQPDGAVLLSYDIAPIA